MATLHIYLSEEDLEFLRDEAAKRGVTAVSLAEAAIENEISKARRETTERREQLGML